MSVHLEVFDFDGTLFKSPEPSAVHWGQKLNGRIRNTRSQKGVPRDSIHLLMRALPIELKCMG